MVKLNRSVLSVALSLLLLTTAACEIEFDLGVAAFEVGPRQAVLWTHVSPADPKAKSVTLKVEVARDPDFTQIADQRLVAAGRGHDFTARVIIKGLSPSTQYYYRFSNPMAESQVGSFRTAPVANDPAPMRFVVTGDSNIGYTSRLGLDFHVLSAAAQEDADFFVYFGDTIYADSGVLPGGADAFTLDEYRSVHRMTRSDPHLQALLASTGTYAGWDDHEVVNDYAGASVDPQQFANGSKAFFEYLPTARKRIDRRVRWGEHVELFFVDGRQFRSAPEYCNPDPIPDGPLTAETLSSPFLDELLAAQIFAPAIAAGITPLLLPSDVACVLGPLSDPSRTMLGADQLEWLKQALVDSTATFKIVVNNTPMSSILLQPYDRWEGYRAERDDLLSFIESNLDPTHTLLLTTDFHTNMAFQRNEFTELIVGPIGQSTFGTGVLQQVPPGPLADLVFPILNQLFDAANGVGSLLGAEHDAFSYAVVELLDVESEPRLRVTVRGNPDYAAGANDPALVRDLFSFELP